MSGLDLNAVLQKLGPRFEACAAEYDDADRFLSENIAELKTEKVYSALVPAEIGGGGATHSQVCAFLRALAHHCPSTALALSMHQHLVAAALFNHRNGRPGLKVLERVAASEAVLVSTGANDWLESNGTAQQVEGGFRISARKAFASGSPAGDVLVTSFAWKDSPAGPEVLHCAVPLRGAGVSIANDWRTMGMRATGSHTVILDDVFVPDEAIVLRRPRGRFHPVWNIVIGVAMPIIMSVYAGVAESAARKGRELAAGRREDPGVQLLAGELENALVAAQLAVDDMVRLANDLDFSPGVELTSAMLARKTIAAQHVLATAEKALETAGGAGYYRANGLERLVRDAHGAQFHPLPAKRQQAFTGRVALGLEPIAA